MNSGMIPFVRYFYVVIDGALLSWLLAFHLPEVVLGGLFAMPFGWLLVWLIFKGGGRNSRSHTVGERVNWFNRNVANFLRIMVALLALVDWWWFDSQLNIIHLIHPDSSIAVTVLTLLSVIIKSLSLQTFMLFLLFDILAVVGYRDFYNIKTDLPSRSYIAGLAFLLPFVPVFLVWVVSALFVAN